MPANKKILIKPKAYQDIENIYFYSLKEFGSKRAKKYIQDLNKTFLKLAANPNLGKDCNVIRPSIMAYKATSHLIFYKIHSDNITIIRILHQAMNHEIHLK